ncbi:hypothetical protein KJ910_05040 [Patescibacteria group bacterium]|nr:hypothetical protein [Patescibacteria group bacterium]
MYFIPRETRGENRFWTLVASLGSETKPKLMSGTKPKPKPRVSLQFENHGHSIAHAQAMRLATDDDLRQLIRIIKSHPEISQLWLERACKLEGFSEPERLRRVFEQVVAEQTAATITC